jgi:hypothetical protein
MDMWKNYQKYLEKNEQKDPDFQGLSVKFD